jgi:hypothetical protein
MKGKHLTLAKKCLYQNEFCGKLLKAAKMVCSKFWPYYIISISLERSLNIMNCQKWGETPYQNMSFSEILKNNSIVVLASYVDTNW